VGRRYSTEQTRRHCLGPARVPNSPVQVTGPPLRFRGNTKGSRSVALLLTGRALGRSQNV